MTKPYEDENTSIIKSVENTADFCIPVSDLSSVLQSLFLQEDHSIKVKCTAMLGNVYLKSNEVSFEVKRPRASLQSHSSSSSSSSSSAASKLIPALESRDGKLTKQGTAYD